VIERPWDNAPSLSRHIRLDSKIQQRIRPFKTFLVRQKIAPQIPTHQ
jgi:hypothetical protein